MKTIVVGMDISKKTIDATVVFLGKENCYHDSFLNKPFGYGRLLHWACKYGSKDSLFFCLEHTGYYGRGICSLLDKEGFEYTLANPLSIKRSMGLRREKSDKYDSKIIGLYGLKFYEELRTGTLLKEELLVLQMLLSHRKRIQEKELAYQRQEKLLRHCFARQKSVKFILDDVNKQRLYLKKHRCKIESKIDEYVFSVPAVQINYSLLTSIPGIGRITALNTIVQTHNFKQIATPRKFSCYCGVAPFKHESGTSVRKGTRISFYGNKKLKGLLNFCALTAVKCDPQIKAYYQRKVKEGKNKMSVLNAVRNKLIHRMYATIRRGTPYVVQPVF